MIDKTIYDLPDMTVKALKKHQLELIDKAINQTKDTSVKRGLLWAKDIIENDKL